MEGGFRFRPEALGLDASYMPRKCSPAWKAPLPGWKQMLDEASAKMASTPYCPRFFFEPMISGSPARLLTLCAGSFDSTGSRLRWRSFPHGSARPGRKKFSRRRPWMRTSGTGTSMAGGISTGKKRAPKVNSDRTGPPSASTKIFFRAALKWSAFSVPISFRSLLLHGTVFPRLL